MELFAGIEPLNLPSRFAAANRRIVLHAAIYGPFADSQPHRDGLAAALTKSTFEALDVIAMDEDEPWTGHFLHALRFGQSSEAQIGAVEASRNFLEILRTNSAGKIRIHGQRTIPCLPIVIIDDTIIFGQYAHCGEFAAAGFWGMIEADVETLFQWAATGSAPADASKTDIAAYRLVCECHTAMTGARGDADA